MQGLMVKLLNVDTPGERALRVVAYFDQLMSNSPDLDAVLRATAVIADCPAGLELPQRGTLLRYSEEGAELRGAPTHVSQQSAVDVSLTERGSVWLERSGAGRELDEFIVERFALTVVAVLARQRHQGDADAASGLSDPALAQLLVNAQSPEAERSRAARLLGLDPASPVQLIAIETDGAARGDALARTLREAWSRPVYVAPLSRHLLLAIAPGHSPVGWAVEHGIVGRAASGPVVDVLDAPRSWRIARDALRFAGAASPWPCFLNADELGVLTLLGALDPAIVAEHPDVVRMEQVASGPHGAESVDMLDHYLHAESLRSAARATNFHHSSLQSRVERIGRTLQIDLRSPGGRQRATMALLLWRISRGTHG